MLLRAELIDLSNYRTLKILKRNKPSVFESDSTCLVDDDEVRNAGSTKCLEYISLMGRDSWVAECDRGDARFLEKRCYWFGAIAPINVYRDDLDRAIPGEVSSDRINSRKGLTAGTTPVSPKIEHGDFAE